MKATIVLLADVNAENYGRDLMLKAHRAAGTGFEMARLPQHVSLKQPFRIESLDEFVKFFDEFASQCSPITLELEEFGVYPSSVIAGRPSGCLSVGVKRTAQLESMQREFFEKA